ncbi:protein translocase subunit yajC [Methylovirgula ligni]|uniref:Sec translocon accessory complex subunit YajC n=2 Tax=Methylovirgula ligni TaxID=569860 RepID=A0A3D9YX48_9HYPH|nr:protein translocase subunit yajC [Methylovirgula ligni]
MKAGVRVQLGAIAFVPALAIVPAQNRDEISRAGSKPLKEKMLFTPAFAQVFGGAPGGASDIFGFIAPFALIVIIMYFLVIRPQQKNARTHADIIKNVRRGDTIVMNGGLIGKVARVVDDNELELEIAPNIKVRVARALISEVRSKGEPVKDSA